MIQKAFSEVYRILKPQGFFINGFVDKINTVEIVKDGYGEGSFIVIRAQK